jgi:hypothetical protein
VRYTIFKAYNYLSRCILGRFLRLNTRTVRQFRRVSVLREESSRQGYTSTNFAFIWGKLFRLILSDSNNKQLAQILITSNTAVRTSNQQFSVKIYLGNASYLYIDIFPREMREVQDSKQINLAQKFNGFTLIWLVRNEI